MKDNYKFREANFTPSTNRVILKATKFYTYKQMQRVLDDEANAGKDPMNDEMVTTMKDLEVKYGYQIMEIVALPADDKNGYKVGDKVLLDYRAAKKFDLYKDLYWVWTMDIVGVVNS